MARAKRSSARCFRAASTTCRPPGSGRESGDAREAGTGAASRRGVVAGVTGGQYTLRPACFPVRRRSMAKRGHIPTELLGLVGQAPKEVFELDWELFGELCRALALRVYREYDPDLVVGIATAGV